MQFGFTLKPEHDIDRTLALTRQAEAAGFLVVRQRSVEFPDGRRLRTYSPYETDDEDE